MTIFTVGHSNSPAEHLVALLQKHEIQTLVDTRSSPYSRYSPQYNRETLESVLRSHGIPYMYMGDRLGGRPSDTQFDLSNGKVDYDRLASAPFYMEGISLLQQMASTTRLAILCSEGHYEKCHRHHLITRTLLQQDIFVSHILPSGELVEASLAQFQSQSQLSLFE